MDFLFQKGTGTLKNTNGISKILFVNLTLQNTNGISEIPFVNCTLRRAVGENNKHRQDGRQTPQPILSFEDFFASKSSKDRQFLGVPAKKETMKKHDLPFADAARLKPDASPTQAT